MIVDTARFADPTAPQTEVITKGVFQRSVVEERFIVAGITHVESKSLGRDASAGERIEGGVQADLGELEGAIRGFAQIIVIGTIEKPLADEAVEIDGRRVSPQFQFPSRHVPDQRKRDANQ